MSAPDAPAKKGSVDRYVGGNRLPKRRLERHQVQRMLQHRDYPLLITIAEAAVLLRTSTAGVYTQWCPRGQLPGVNLSWAASAPATRRPVKLAGPEPCAVSKESAMSVTVRPYRRGGWEVDIRGAIPRDVAAAMAAPP